jgi:two-component system CheB/CheR fusion protein
MTTKPRRKVEPPEPARFAGGEGGAPDENAEPRGGAFPIVGVGASAGGLEAFSELLAHLPGDTGMAFVLVQHLDPQHESALTQLLARVTSLPVVEATRDVRVQPNHVYVIAPDTQLGIEGGVLKLSPRSQARMPNRSIDYFLEALAADQHERAIGVILSGTASDGTLGLEAVKAEGGVTFAQDETARYDSMPRSAVAAGCVDFVLSPRGIAEELARVARHPYVVGAAPASPIRSEDDHAQTTAFEADGTPLSSGGHGTPPNDAQGVHAEAGRGGDGGGEGYRRILMQLRHHSGVDFSLYKSSTIQRRIARRMMLGKHDTPELYSRFLRGNAKELDALYADVLISVTSFFRNPESFEVIQRDVLPALLAQPRGDEPLRVWVLGCSTGQEAYSMAMAFVEAAEQAPRDARLQVFATDLNEALLEKARHGLYAKSLAQDLSPERLRRFFVAEEGGYRITKAMREMVVFARQNLIADPPFSRMDMITCRNLLIYLEGSLQRKVFPVFHYALKPNGYLWLGASESIGGFTELFHPLDKKHKIYTRKAVHTPSLQLPVKRDRHARMPPGEPSSGDRSFAVASRMGGAASATAADGFRAEANAQREADRIMVNQFAPPGVLVNDEAQILQFRGSTGTYLEAPAGKASFDVLKMARPGLLLPLRAALDEARKGNTATRRDNVRVKHGDTTRLVDLQVVPLKNLRERCFLILFEDAAKPARGARTRAGEGLADAPNARAPRSRGAEQARRIAELETELAETRDYLQAMQEQHEGANEELQASNEEVQSANEELQSLNEELETSKEELESSNEELTTVNEEMEHRNVELRHLNNDMINVQTSARLVLLMLARNLTVRQFSAQAEQQFKLTAADVGRPVGHLRHGLQVPDLEALIVEVIDTVRAAEREVQDENGRWYSLRVRPYLTLDNKIDGAVLVLDDIDALKRSEQAAASARDLAENVTETVRESLLVLDSRLQVERANAAFYRSFGVTPAATVGKSIFEINRGQWDIALLRTALLEILPKSNTLEGFVVEHDFPGLGFRTLLLNARRMRDPQRRTELILLAIEDITERERAAAGVARLAAIVASSDDAIVSKDLRGIIQTWNAGAEQLFGYTAQEAVGQPVSMLIPVDRPDEEPGILERIARGEAIEHYEAVRRHKDGSLFDVSLTISPVRDARGRIIGAAKIARDVTERKHADAALRQSEQRFRDMVDALPAAIYTTDAEGRLTHFNPACVELSGRTPHIGTDQWCVSWKLFQLDGTPMPHDECPMAVVLRTGRMMQGAEIIVERPDGSRVWCKVYPSVQRDGQGRVIGGMNMLIDVTEARNASEIVRLSEERYQSLFDAAPMALFVCDADAVIQRYNRRAAEIWGREPVCGVERHCGSVSLWLPDGTRLPHTESPIVEVLRTGVAAEQVEVSIERPDGSRLPVLANFSALKDAGGAITGAITSFVDISERKGSEQALRDADRHKDEFLAMLAHELRNPLAPIRNALEIVRPVIDDAAGIRSLQAPDPAAPGHGTQAKRAALRAEAVHAAMGMLDRQVGQLVRLVDDLLDANRISRGRIELRRERVDVARLVADVVESARPVCESRGHELTATWPAAPIHLNADPVRMEQVVGNLLNNACKFTGVGGRIRVDVEIDGAGPGAKGGTAKGGARSSRHGPQVVIRVSDTGLGLAPEQLDRIFQMFTQVDASAGRLTTGGLGIGLALVRDLVTRHGGTVAARSAGLGHGSEFEVRLPILTEGSVASAGPALPEPPAGAAASANPTGASPAMVAPAPDPAMARRILVVDDNHDSTDSLAMVLEFKGQVTRTAYDGLEALEAAAEFRPDLVLLDIGLPRLDGLEVARRLRAQRPGEAMLLIALTGWGQDEDRERSMQAGFDAHMVKPLDVDALLAWLAARG